MEPEPEIEPEPSEEGVPAAPGGDEVSAEEKLSKLEAALLAGALDRGPYERLVAQVGGEPVAAEPSGAADDATREAILKAKLAQLDKSASAGDLSAEKCEAMRVALGAQPSPVPLLELEEGEEMDEEWASMLKLLTAATRDEEEPPQFDVIKALESSAHTATKPACSKAAKWLAARFTEVPHSYLVRLKVLNVIWTCSTHGGAFLQKAVADACLPVVEQAAKFHCKPHPFHGDEPKMLVRTTAKEMEEMMRNVAYQAARLGMETMEKQSVALNARASLRDLEQASTRPEFVHSPKTRKDEKKHQKMFREMEKAEEKAREAERKAAAHRGANAKIWATEILPKPGQEADFEQLRTSKRVKELLWEGIPFEVRGQAWHCAIGAAVSPDYKALSATLDELMSGADDAKPEWIDLIAVDLKRTFSKWIADTTSGRHRALYDVASERAKDGDECLRRVLGAYALHNPALGYTQGMSFIVAMLLLYTEPEEAFGARRH